ncbi:MAG TPA: hypothetical protein V6C81_08475 [Planktothrix sp.]
MKLKLDLGTNLLLDLNFVDDDPTIAQVRDEVIAKVQTFFSQISRGHPGAQELVQRFQLEKSHIRLWYSIDGRWFCLTDCALESKVSKHSLSDGMIVSSATPPKIIESSAFEHVRKILFYEWDPISVSPNINLIGEYDDYVPEVIRLLVEHGTNEQLTEYLKQAEDGIGISTTDENRAKVVSKLMKYVVI